MIQKNKKRIRPTHVETPLMDVSVNPLLNDNPTSDFFHVINCDKDLCINEIKSTEHSKPNVNKLLPQPPFLMGVVAPRRSGKTNTTVDLLLDTKKYRNVFDDIYIWSQTFFLDNKWKRIKLEEDHVFNTWNEADCTEAINKAEEQVSNDSTFHTLFIFDDMIDAKIMNVNKLGSIESLAVRGRHSNISVIIISQQYMSLSTPIRNNITNLIIFRIRNSDELRKIIRENQESLTTNEFLKIYNHATCKPFNFLHINNQESNPRLRFRMNWNTLIIIDNNE